MTLVVRDPDGTHTYSQNRENSVELGITTSMIKDFDFYM